MFDCVSLPPCPADPSSYQFLDYRSGDITRCLMVSTRAGLSQEQIFALFDLIPGMEYCELQRDTYGMSKGEWIHRVELIKFNPAWWRNVKKCVLCLSGHALIRYSNLGSAVYAKEKLNGFEYPPGNRLVVNFVDDGEDRSRCTHNAIKSFSPALTLGLNVTTNESPWPFLTPYVNNSWTTQ